MSLSSERSCRVWGWTTSPIMIMPKRATNRPEGPKLLGMMQARLSPYSQREGSLGWLVLGQNDCPLNLDHFQHREGVKVGELVDAQYDSMKASVEPDTIMLEHLHGDASERHQALHSPAAPGASPSLFGSVPERVPQVHHSNPSSPLHLAILNQPTAAQVSWPELLSW